MLLPQQRCIAYSITGIRHRNSRTSKFNVNYDDHSDKTNKFRIKAHQTLHILGSEWTFRTKAISWGQLYCILIRQQKHAPTLQYGYKRRCKRSEGDHCVDNTLWLLCQATVRKVVQIRNFTIFGYKRVSGIYKE